MYLITNGKVITRDSENPYFQDGGVAVEGNKIIEVGDDLTLKLKYPNAEIIDAEGNVIMPAFINAHTHIYSALARGLSVNGYNPTNFIEVLEGMWWNIDRKLTLGGTRASAYAAYIECIKNGVTTIFDHHASYCEIPGSLFEIAEVAKELGVRSCLCYEVSDRDGEYKCKQGIKENYDFIKYTKDEPDSMLKAMFGMHAPFTLSDKTMEKCIEMNNSMTGYHIHVSEGPNDVHDTWEKYKKRPVERLRDLGILGEKTILGHCIHVDDNEMNIIKETNTMVVNNPESNMGNAIGCSPILNLYSKGILIGLGTDAYTHDMLESLKAALAIQRHNAKMPNVGWCEVTDMLFKNNALIGARYFDEPLGVLKAGAAADIIVMDYKPYTPFSDKNIDGHMLFGMNGRQCLTTVANGRILMKNRELVGIDEEEINAKILETSKDLWKRING
ncbi:MAG: putative aminohydrolase SsnA [Candidatus Metalachnospira sp.]|nr:putative aminohydrolase SsnA [Candidatus Metalachnospira sp.]